MTAGPLRFGGLATLSAGAGAIGELRTFYHYVFTEWVDHHQVPTEADELARFDVMSAHADYRTFLAAGGAVRTGDLGVTTEQMWLGSQAVSGVPLVLVVNAANSADEPVHRVTRKALIAAQLIQGILPRLFPIRLNRRGVEEQRHRWGSHLTPSYLAGVHDGRTGHAILLIGLDRDGTGVYYRESWPTGSFLQAGNNAAAVAAAPLPSDPGLFHVQVQQLLAVLRIMLLPVAAYTAATGDSRFAAGPPATVASPSAHPPDAAERTRKFLEHCRERDLLTEQAIADLTTLFDAGTLFKRDRHGNDVLHHLNEMATTPRAPGVDRRALLCDALRAMAQPR